MALNNERLDDRIRALKIWIESGRSSAPDLDRDTLSALTELQALRASSGVEVSEIKMTPIEHGLPKRDELRGEQTILTYNDKVGTWDISFMEAGWDDFDAGFALGVTHWLDITSMWPGVIAQVSSLSSPLPTVEVTEEMVRRFVNRYREMWPGAGWPVFADAVDLLTAALSQNKGE